jgi:hypothetical protein
VTGTSTTMCLDSVDLILPVKCVRILVVEARMGDNGDEAMRGI